MKTKKYLPKVKKIKKSSPIYTRKIKQNFLRKKRKRKMKKKKIYNIYNESRTTEHGEKKMTKVLQSMMIEARDNNKLIAEIEVPINYKPIINDIAIGKASADQMTIYDQIIEKFINLNENQRQTYRALLFSGKYRTEKLSDLLEILDIVKEYLMLPNTPSFEALGHFAFMATMLSGEFKPTHSIDNLTCFALGRQLTEKFEGFFMEDKFYGKLELMSGLLNLCNNACYEIVDIT